jgi:hypothetical protein
MELKSEDLAKIINFEVLNSIVKNNSAYTAGGVYVSGIELK